MTARDLSIWRAWLELEPRGDERADCHAAFIASQVLTAQFGDKAPSTIDCLEMLRCLWAEPHEIQAAVKRRKLRKERRKAKQLRAMAFAAKFEEMRRAAAKPNGQH